MKRPIVCALDRGSTVDVDRARRRKPSTVPACGFTLIEVLVATVLTLIIMAAVVTVFAAITTSISQSRSTLEMTDRLRTTATQLKRDLEGVTVTMLPPRRPENNEGYFEYIEGPVGPVFMPETRRSWAGSTPTTSDGSPPYAFDVDRTPPGTTTAVADTTVGDNDDILMFTTRAKDRPFVGRYPTATALTSTTFSTTESWVAEVAWFVRGRTLYRRVLLVAPSAFSAVNPNNTSVTPAVSYYTVSDVSAHLNSTGMVVPNSLGDLTKRENRFAHPYDGTTPPQTNPVNTTNFPKTAATTFGPYMFPYDARVWGQYGLPTLRETAHPAYILGKALPGPTSTMGTATTAKSASPPPFMARDFWTNPYPWPANSYVDPTTGTQWQFYDPNPSRITDDVVLNNVLGFDVKAWDPGAPIFKAATSGAGANVPVMPGDPYYTTNFTTMIQNITSNTNTQPLYYGAYVDLGWDPNYTNTTWSYAAQRGKYTPGAPLPFFDHWGLGYVTGSNPSNSKMNAYLSRSALAGNNPNTTTTPPYYSARVYDTYSLHYEYDGVIQPTTGASVADIGTNGADDDTSNGADDPGEAETCPPYPVPLRGIQVKIRTMDPDSGQIREVTVIQDFLPQ